MAETVSVIIPAYNAAMHVTRAIESALAQTHPAIEILVVDDGSNDRTAAVVAAMPPPVRLIRKENGGPASARNLGAAQAQGDWLALLDADDWWFPDKLRAQLAMARPPEIGLIHCLPDHRNDSVPLRLGFDDLWARNWIINSSVLIRRSAFEALGGFNEARELISVEDYNLWVRMVASDWRIVTCPQVLVHYTRGIGISSNSENYMRAGLFNIDELGRCLSLPAEMVRRKRNETISHFARRALFERDLTVARQLSWRAFRDTPSIETGLHLAISAIPAPILDIRRRAVRLLERTGSGTTPGAEGQRHRGQAHGGRAHGGQACGNLAHDRAAGGALADVDQTGGNPGIDDAWLPGPGSVRTSILDRRFHIQTDASRLAQPMLVTTVDAEEDFDWTRPFSRASTDVTSMRSQHIVHRVFERYGVVPTYMVDHPVASQDEGRAPLKELLEGGACEIGAQLHPWITPPFIEDVSLHNSYPGNLPPALEFAKIQALTGELEAAFGVTPRIFRAGRYGVGPHTGDILRHFGYQADSSVVPCWSFRDQGGPDFRLLSANPYWIDSQRSILELPVSAAVVGRASALPVQTRMHLFGRTSERVGLPSVLSHLGLLERIKLTPEGMVIAEAKRLVRHMIATGHRVFVLTYHSPSLEPGNTPYVRTPEDLATFLRWLEELYDFFTTEIGGRCVSWREVRAALADDSNRR